VKAALLCCVCRTGTWAVCWSPSNEHQLLSGDAAGEVRVWDVRRSGTRALLDVAVTHRPKHRPSLGTATAAAGINGKAANGQGFGSVGSAGVKRKAAAAGGFAAEDDTNDDPRFGVGVRHSGRATKPLAHEAPVTGGSACY
jgi:DNA excision repair protein ERCC-8